MDQMILEIFKIAVCAVASIIGILIARVAVPYIESLKLNEEQKIILTMVEAAVKAMEQTIKQSGQGSAKKAQVVAFVSHYLSEKGIHISGEELDKLIEAAVYAMKKEVERQ